MNDDKRLFWRYHVNRDRKSCRQQNISKRTMKSNEGALRPRMAAALFLYKENHALDAWFGKAYGVEQKILLRWLSGRSTATIIKTGKTHVKMGRTKFNTEMVWTQNSFKRIIKERIKHRIKMKEVAGIIAIRGHRNRWMQSVRGWQKELRVWRVTRGT